MFVLATRVEVKSDISNFRNLLAQYRLVTQQILMSDHHPVLYDAQN